MGGVFEPIFKYVQQRGVCYKKLFLKAALWFYTKKVSESCEDWNMPDDLPASPDMMEAWNSTTVMNWE